MTLCKNFHPELFFNGSIYQEINYNIMKKRHKICYTEEFNLGVLVSATKNFYLVLTPF